MRLTWRCGLWKPPALEGTEEVSGKFRRFSERLASALALAFLPVKLQSELHLTRSGGGAGDGSRGAGWLAAGGRGRREDDEIGGVEIGAVQKVEDFRAKLQTQALPQRDVLQDREIPGGKSRAEVSVAADVSVEAACRRR